MIKDFEDIGISDDFMFGTIMENPQYCKPFLETVLGVRIERIEYLDFQKAIDLKVDAKSVRLDAYVADERHTVYNVEMQTGRKGNLPKRSRYYQGMVDLNILNKGMDYRELRKTYIIFVCTFDMFGENRHVYTFENRCVENLDLSLGDETVKIFLNTKGTADDVSEEMRNLLEYIDGKMPLDAFTRELDEEVKRIRQNEKWRGDYMTLALKYQEKYAEGKEEGRVEGKINMLVELVNDKTFTEEEAARRGGMSVEEFRRYMKQLYSQRQK